MPEILTNRDLYLAIEHLITENKSNPRSLEEYLRALLQLSSNLVDRKLLTATEFYSLLRESFIADPLEFDDTWRDLTGNFTDDLSGFEKFRKILILQIVDLREMAETKILEGEYIYFGVDAPRGSRWYNFHPSSYLECGMAGTFGGWEPGDNSGRDFVPGLASVMAEDGLIRDVNPQDLARPVSNIPTISWDEFGNFLGCGQWYE